MLKNFVVVFLFSFCLFYGKEVYSKDLKKPQHASVKAVMEDFIIIDLRQKRASSSARMSIQNISDNKKSGNGSGSDVVVFDLARGNGSILRDSPARFGTSVLILDGESIQNGVEAQNAPISHVGDKYLPIISEIAGKYNIDPQLVKIIIEVESGFNPYACSGQDAMGLMQIIPETAKSLNLADPFDPYENILAGVRYLRLQLDRFGCIELALAAYNAGPGAVEKYGGIPPFRETQNYVRTIMDKYYNGE